MLKGSPAKGLVYSHLPPEIYPVLRLGMIATVIFIICSAVRHALFNSNGWDLGIFDQAIYLISQGQVPVSTFLGFHILADHAALVFYPLALLYRIYADVHWLFVVQAVVLASGVLPTWYLARQAGLTVKMRETVAIAYILYPLIFNINLFDFHPDVWALPGILWAVLAARAGRLGWFCGLLISIVICKGALALTIAALGVWLLGFEKKRLAGAIAFILGVAWFILAIKFVIPYFGTDAASLNRHLNRYQHLGDGYGEIAKNLIFNPLLLLKSIFNLANLGYLVLLLGPLAWGLSVFYLWPLIGAIPALAMNLLTQYQAQKDLIHQYALPILPFVLLCVIGAIARDRHWLKPHRLITLWSLIAFFALAKYGYFWSIYLRNLDTWGETRAAIALIQDQGSVLTNSEISPHLSHRKLIAMGDNPSLDYQPFQHILLNARYSSYSSPPEVARQLIKKIRQDPGYQLVYRKNRVFLFNKISKVN